MKVSEKKLDRIMMSVCIDPMELSKKAGVCYPSIVRARSRKHVRHSTIGKIAAALNVDPAELIEEE